MLEYLVFRLLSLLAPRIPLRVAYWLCNPIGDLTYWLLARQRRVVHRNLSVVLSSQSQGLNRLARQLFREGAKNYYDTFLAPSLSDLEVERLITLEGWDNLESALERGKGAILVTAHLGSPALVAQVVAARNRKMTVVVEPIRPQELFDLMARVRTRGDLVTVVPFGPTVTQELAEILRRNELVGIVADRDVSKNGVPVQFFGLETLLPVGPVMLALRTGAALLPAFTYRRRGGGFTAWIGEPLRLERSRNLRADLRQNTQMIARVFEEAIRKSPEQWTVFEPIWPEDEPAARVGAAS